MERLTHKELEDFLKSIGDDFGKHHVWTAEDGTPCSSWHFKTENMSIHTGDGGAELMRKAFLDKLQEYPKINLEN